MFGRKKHRNKALPQQAEPQVSAVQAVPQVLAVQPAPSSDQSRELVRVGLSQIEVSQDSGSIQLVHPVYLDVPMMASFYASEGLTIDLERVANSMKGADTEGRLSAEAKAGLPGLLGMLAPVSVNASANMERKTRSEESVEIRSVYQHSESSLFNALRKELVAKKVLRKLISPGKPGGDPLQAGQLVEIPGRIIGNPLESLLEAYDRLLPYAGIHGEPPKATSEPPRTWYLASRKVSSLVNNLVTEDRNRPKLARILREDLAKASVRDVVLTCDEIPDTPVVLIVSTEFFTSKAVDYLVDGQFTVVGKVTSLADPGVAVDLMRRTALATMSPEKAQGLITQLGSDVEALGASSSHLRQFTDLRGCLQLLPLAIFI